ncbi:aspartyl protease family protein At5g10770-like [Panicum hallii]|nr:aspartyl protease family protein At5g10770-like [Panicum hallii]
MAWGACIAALPLLLLLLLAAAAGGNGGVHCLEQGSRSRSRRALQGRHKHHLRSRAVGGATVLELRHHSFSSAPSKSREEEADAFLSSDAARVASLQWRIENYRLIGSAAAASKAQVPVSSGAKLRTLNYVATVGLGGGEATVIVDTASELTWVQCKPCDSCHDQQEPLFDPSSSPSYAAVPCNSSSCDALQVATGMSGSPACGGADRPACSYTLSYRDGSYSRGVLARDKLSLAGEAVDGFVFGCGTSNQGAPFGGTSGLMGLGRSQLSLVSQTADQFGGVFSYCLPLKESDSSGSLVLGDDSSVYRNSTPIVYTSMVSDPLQGPFYFLNLTGITVGGQEVESPGFSSGKVIVDSGTVITSLAPSIYNAVKAEILSQFAEYPQAPAFSILDTCFDMTGFKEVQVPSLKLVFDGGVEVEVDSSGVLYFVSSDSSQVCLAMAALRSEYETSIIGNYQQKNLRVIFDTSASQVGFAQETCGYI